MIDLPIPRRVEPMAGRAESARPAGRDQGAGGSKTRNRRERMPASLWFLVHGTLFSCLILQKFGFVFGASYLNLGLPVFLALLPAVAFAGHAAFLPSRMLLASMLVAMMCASAFLTNVIADPRGYSSITSLGLTAVIYLSLSLCPRDTRHGATVVSIFLNYCFVIACLGIFQYFAQFVGLRIVSLGSSLPFLQPFLVERFFNSDAIIEYGSNVIRSNGLVLLEPSTLSQLIVFAAALEITILKRYKRLPVFAIGYLVTYSGTGMLAALFAVALYAALSLKAAFRAMGLALIGMVAIALLFVVTPDIVGRYADRILEFGQPGTSAYERYVAQKIAWTELMRDSSILTGLGPGTFERHFVPQGMASNSIVKLASDYGIIVALLWLATFLYLFWTPRARLLGLMVLSLTILGGGNELNPTFLFPMAIACIWSGLVLPVRAGAPKAEPIARPPSSRPIDRVAI